MDIFKILDVSTTQYILFGGIILGLLIVFLVLFIWASRRKRRRQELSNDFADMVLKSLGGADNIVKVKLSRRRLKVELKHVEMILPKLMRELKLGAIVSKQVVTILVKDNPKEVYEFIEIKRKEVKKWKKHS